MNLLWKQPTGIGLTFYPFTWKIGFWKFAGGRIAQIGPFGLVISSSRLR